MFDPSSRYYTIDNATISSTDDDGTLRQIVYKRRRFIPVMDDGTTLVEHTVADGQRPDNITAQYLGDPTQFWRLCDANGARFPDDLVAQIGTVLKIILSRP
jgi:hypothetical protein